MLGMRKPLLITGANGLIGRLLCQSLKSNYKLILVDRHIGQDPYNRYGLEKTSPDADIPRDGFHQIDLSLDKKRFAELLQIYKPSCVLHLAGLLENQEPELIKSKNRHIHENVLQACAEACIPLIAMSSIMVLYGTAMQTPKVRLIMENKFHTELLEEERLTVNTPLDNTEATIKAFNPETFEKNLAYIKSKEHLETIAREHASAKPSSTIVAIRLGWCSIKNPFELEGKVPHSEITACLAKEDLLSAIDMLISNIISNKITGYRCYCLISEHPQRWTSLKNIENDLGWKPSVNILERFAIKPAKETDQTNEALVP
ncbi:MAG: dependent epimerase/dehydratase family [Gammaproteobacteria bacterium]|jgi:nucleoside-diphosphate-sugar epimerase|nr:dependent epimerase/dehydratase family [Gammaproteobacteria bacterium]